MRIFASERVSALMQKLGMEEGEAIEHPWVNKAIENAQRKVEGRNFDIRKQLLEYDDVANDQRKVVYQQRDELMDADDISETITNLRYDMVNGVIDTFIPPQSLEEQWDIPGLTAALEENFALVAPVQQWLDEDDSLHEEPLRQRILDELVRVYEEKEAQAGAEQMRRIEKEVMLFTLDSHWKEHLAAMDYLRQGIHLRGYAQKNPKQEYKREAFAMFSAMLDAIKLEVVQILCRLQLQAPPSMPERLVDPSDFEFKHETFEGLGGEPEAPPAEAGMPEEKKPFVRPDRKVGRNDPCPCGSGKKYKHCHGKLN
jgi:preprotein translocase subunit SecA